MKEQKRKEFFKFFLSILDFYVFQTNFCYAVYSVYVHSTPKIFEQKSYL